MRVVFAGTPAAAVPALRAIAESRHDLVAVVTRPDARAGRGRGLRRSDVGQLADELGVPVLTPQHPRDDDFVAELTALAPDCVPIVAYGALVPAPVLAIPRHGWVNLHFSLLPAWRGAAPVQHAILAGDEITGATTFRLDEGMDTGDVFGVVTEEIRPRDTAGDLLARLATSGAGLLVATLDGIEASTLVPVPQPNEDVSLAPKITADDARVVWQDPAMRVDRLIRACTPAPGAWTTFRGDRVKLGPVAPVAAGGVDVVPELAPGQVHVAKAQVLVGTATNPVELSAVQPPGRQAMAADAWARGARPSIDDRFE